MRLLGVLLVLSLAAPLRAGEEPELTKADRDQLARDKLLVTDRSLRQVFTVYRDAEMPVFITSGSALAPEWTGRITRSR